MQLQVTDASGQTHNGQKIKSILIREDNGTPLAIIKETVIGDLKNYKILTPGEPDFDKFARTLGFNLEVMKF